MTRIVVLGSPDFAVPTLRAVVAAGHDVAAVVTQPDRAAGRGRQLAPSPMKVAAQSLGLPVLQPPSLRRAAAVADLAALHPDVMVVAAFGQILRPAVLELAPHGVLNVHASLLPRWRGASPVVAAIRAGDHETGVSIMLLDQGLDTGPVLARRATVIADADTGGSLTGRLAEMGAGLLVETLPRWLTSDITPEPQRDDLATYAPRLEKEVGVIDWSGSATHIWRSVRAYTPWPGAHTTYCGQPLRIIGAWPVRETTDEEPGTVVALSQAARLAVPVELPRPAFAVATGEGLLVPLKLQRAGKRAVFAEEFLRGERGLIGSRLGDVVA